MSPAEETVCDVLDPDFDGAAWGLCNAYCEAMDCDGEPRASQKACDKVRARYDSLGAGSLPCLDKLVFATSQRYTGVLVGDANALGGNFDDTQGLLAGDFICDAHAEGAVGGPLPGQYAAWLSATQGDVDAVNRLTPDSGPFVLVDRVTVVDEDANELTLCDEFDECLQNPINLDENGDMVGGRVWTATGDTGTRLNDVVTCEDWTSIQPLGAVGRATLVNRGWTAAADLSCGGAARLYCFQK